jgi:dTDP-L-rhamnose 4-epimerase
MNVLITGGLGFIGRAIIPRFLAAGCQVRIVDNLEPTVHGRNPDLGRLTAPWSHDVDLIVDSVTRRDVVERAIRGIDAIVHLAGLTSIPGSIREPAWYSDVNVTATALLCEFAMRERVAAVTLASSRAVYGEGPYRCGEHGPRVAVRRSARDLEERRWDPRCEICGKAMNHGKAMEQSSPQPVSVYGLTKLAQ